MIEELRVVPPSPPYWPALPCLKLSSFLHTCASLMLSSFWRSSSFLKLSSLLSISIPRSILLISLDLGLRLITKIGLDTPHPPTTHHKLLGQKQTEADHFRPKSCLTFNFNFNFISNLDFYFILIFMIDFYFLTFFLQIYFHFLNFMFLSFILFLQLNFDLK